MKSMNDRKRSGHFSKRSSSLIPGSSGWQIAAGGFASVAALLLLQLSLNLRNQLLSSAINFILGIEQGSATFAPFDHQWGTIVF